MLRCVPDAINKLYLIARSYENLLFNNLFLFIYFFFKVNPEEVAHCRTPKINTQTTICASFNTLDTKSLLRPSNLMLKKELAK